MHPPTPLLAPTVAGLVGLALLMSGCGGSSRAHVAQLGATTSTTESSRPSTTPAQSSRLAPALAFSRCMRSNGVPAFPDPDSQGDFPPFDTGVPKQVAVTANDACKHLLSHGGPAGTPQQRAQKFAFGLKVAQCLRKHGYPGFPDPGAAGQPLPPGVDTNSPHFTATESACERQWQKALGLP
jgi:hypothetical protein